MREGAVEATPRTRATRSTSSPSRSSPIVRRGRAARSTSSTTSSAAPRPSPSCRARSSRACSTCSRAATRRTSSRSCGRASPGTGSRGTVRAREGAPRLAVANARHDPRPRPLRRVPGRRRVEGAGGRRVGELDEEMVFESREGEVFVLGASSWRIAEITRDRVLVAPAPGRARQDAVLARRPRRRGRSSWAGRVGALTRELAAAPRRRPRERLVERARARRRGRRTTSSPTCDEQTEATGAVPDDRTIVAGAHPRRDGRLAAVPPLAVGRPRARAVGARAAGAAARARARPRWRRSGPTTASWSACPDRERPPDASALLPEPDEIEDLVVRELGRHRALRRALPRGRGARAAAAAAPPRPALAALDAAQARGRPAGGRLALRLVPDHPGDLPRVPAGRVRPAGAAWSCSATDAAPRAARGDRRHRARRRRSRPRCSSATSPTTSTTATRRWPSGAPRRSRSTRRSSGSCSARPSCASCSTPRRSPSWSVAARGSTERTHAAHAPTRLHDLLLRLGDLDARRDRGARVAQPPARRAADPRRWPSAGCRAAARAPRHSRSHLAGEERAGRRRGRGPAARRASASPPPPGLPDAFLEPVAGRARGPRRALRAHPRAVPAAEVGAAATAMGEAPIAAALRRSPSAGRVLEGEFRPGGDGREWCDADVLRDAAPALAGAAAQAGRAGRARGARRACSLDWQGVATGSPSAARRARTRCSTSVEQLQGAAFPASRARSATSCPRACPATARRTSTCCARAGEVVWVGLAPLGERDGRIALYLADSLLAARTRRRRRRRRTARSTSGCASTSPRHGASFFAELHRRPRAAACVQPRARRAVGPGVGGRGHERHAGGAARVPARRAAGGIRPRRRPGVRSAPAARRRPSAGGRWSLAAAAGSPGADRRPSARRRSAEQLLARHGVLTRQAVLAEGVPGGFAALYPVLRALEEAGRVRRGYFVAGLGGSQFALPGAPRAAARAARERAGATTSRGGGARRDRSREPLRRRAALAEREARPAPARGRRRTWSLVDGALAGLPGRGEGEITALLPRRRAGALARRAALARALAHWAAAPGARVAGLEQVAGEPIGAQRRWRRSCWRRASCRRAGLPLRPASGRRAAERGRREPAEAAGAGG